MSHQQSVLRDERGVNNLLVSLVIFILLFVAMSVFGIWSYMGRQDYKNNVDEKVETAVAVAIKETKTEKDNEFAEKEKNPLSTYQGPSDLGSIIIKYPKTWSAYVDSTQKSGTPLNGYFYPITVPGVSSETAFALRVEVVDRDFTDTVKSYDSKVKNGKVTVSAYQPVNVENAVGVRVEGEIDNQRQGKMVLLPTRDKTIKLYTESNQFYDDFENNILPNFSFMP